MTDRSATFVIPGIWHLMREMRQEVRTLVADYGPEVQNGAVIAANELVENAIKYGSANPAMADVQLSVEVSCDALTLRVSNGYEDREAAARLLARVKELHAGRDPFELFIERLDEISRERNEAIGLGIYRIAAEGGFRLEAEISDAVVTVIATRSLA